MRIGLIVDGQGELDYLSNLTPRISTSHAILERAYYADMQPRATPQQIARAASNAVKVLSSRCDLIVVLIDSEGADCPGLFSTAIHNAFNEVYSASNIRFKVVAKHWSLENWLIADTDAIKCLKGRFKISDSLVNKVTGDRADHESNPVRELNKIALKQPYHKRHDPKKIAEHQTPEKMAKNSRSFRRLLRVLEHPQYVSQSKKPV